MAAQPRNTGQPKNTGQPSKAQASKAPQAGITPADARRWWALAAVALAVLTVGLDTTILSVALPTLSRSLHASESDLQWFASGYLLVLAAAMLPAGLLGDRYGRRKVLLASLALFGAASAACAYSVSPAEFIAARAAVGLAGAGVIVMAVSALAVLFTEQERPKAVGIWAAANFVALPVGPILGGWILTHFWWGWVFLINVPVAIIGLVAVSRLVPETRSADRPDIDIIGVVSSAAGLVALTYGLIRAGQDGWTDPGALAAAFAGAAVLAGFFQWERHLSRRPGGQPLLDMTLFASASFTWGVILAALAILPLFGALFTLPQYFQGVLGTDAIGSGLRLLPLVGGLIVGAVPADQVVRLAGAKIVVAVGFLLFAAGLLLGATTTATTTGTFTAGWMTLVGLGMGLTAATTASAAVAELSRERSGVGSAVFQAVNKTGPPLGTAVLGSIISAGYLARLSLAGVPGPAAAAARQSIFGGVAVARELRSATLLASARAAFVHGMDTALLVSAGVAVAGLLLTIAFLPRSATGSQAREQAAATDPTSRAAADRQPGDRSNELVVAA
jgi:MFS transporter, DHA2 family, multidrug resistance protein